MGDRVLQDLADADLIPTIILSKEIKDYKIDTTLRQVGTFETDGSFIFRRLELLGTYKDLTTGKTIEPPKQETA